MHTIKDHRTLRALVKAGHVTIPRHHYPANGKAYYVDRAPSLPAEFTHKDKNYRVQYFDGCFFPFVVSQD